MSIRDVLKKSFIESDLFTQVDVPRMLLALAAAFVLGLIIYLIYTKFFTGVIYSRSFAMTLVGMSVLTCMVTLAISSNVVVSLGMVGALSIVRYRTAIKDPMDLLYLFWSITVGITVGAQMFLLAVVASLVMFLLILVFTRKQQSGAVFIAVIHYTGDSAGDEIIRSFGRMRFFVKSKTMRGERTEMAVEVMCRSNDLAFSERIRAIPGVEDISLIQYNGEYHG